MNGVALIISDDGGCLESFPCIHHVTVEMTDGSRKREGLRGVELWRFLKAGRFPSASTHIKNHLAYNEGMVNRLRSMGWDVSPLEPLDGGKATQ
jgi:hypothetical protein